ncbi:hypothetical protein X801_06077 [Opisthorchis viverrini]|uniref:Uncharacterized protein n=1 Tax=Opisthorchis viverrini TaxID=6198 RepID=A0A1S8WUR1_OPIVI|nr:hypothetical protein X801_06077 [Opisthorchis viverrini]
MNANAYLDTDWLGFCRTKSIDSYKDRLITTVANSLGVTGNPRGYQMTLSWIPCQNGNVPNAAVDAADGGGIYVCRAAHSGDDIPGKVVPVFGKAYVPYGGEEHEKYSYEVLCVTGSHGGGFYTWKADSGGGVPKRAVIGGFSSSGEPLYVARGYVDGERVVGKVHDGHQCAYFPHGGREIACDDYEVLVWEK